MAIRSLRASYIAKCEGVCEGVCEFMVHRAACAAKNIYGKWKTPNKWFKPSKQIVIQKCCQRNFVSSQNLTIIYHKMNWKGERGHRYMGAILWSPFYVLSTGARTPLLSVPILPVLQVAHIFQLNWFIWCNNKIIVFLLNNDDLCFSVNALYTNHTQCSVFSQIAKSY